MSDHTTTLTVDGSPIELGSDSPWPAAMSLNLGGYSSLTLARRGGTLPGLVDPWMGKTVSLAIDGTTYFAGRIVDNEVSFPVGGLTTTYLCRDLRAEADRTALTDDYSLTDSAAYNFKSDSPFYSTSRSGKSVGEILADVLTMEVNASFLHSKGIGGYTVTAGPPTTYTLPSSTLADLAALTLIPVQEIRVSGGKLLSALATWLESVQPNHRLHVMGDGTIRVFNLRSVSEHTFTLDFDKVNPPSLRRSVADCYQRVLIRGTPINEGKMYSTALGGLLEKFAWGSYTTNAAAKAAWRTTDYAQDQLARSEGTCTCTDTLTVVLTSNPTTQTWAANAWNQSHGQGYIRLWSTTLTGYSQSVTRLVTSNTSKSSGGTSTFTLDQPLPDLSYDHFTLYGVSSGASYVWRKYQVADSSVWAALQRQFSTPQHFIGSNGDSVSTTSYPIGSVCWSASGSPPYNEFPLFIHSIDNDTGEIIFVAPTYNIAGGPPADVRALLAVNTGTLEAVAPASGYEGTSHDVEGLEETWLVTLPDWKDPGNQSNMEAYAQELLDSVKDSMVEGTVVLNDLWLDALSFGVGVSLTGDGYTTGWEDLNLPVTGVNVTWNNQSASHWTTNLQVGNRFAPLGQAQFMRPERPPASSGWGAFNQQGADVLNKAFGVGSTEGAKS
ncbi:hypothetical protein [Paludisphaera rhizosphaerae]|uniref:hypothetical protein n=1 Tax=Paludisphaera rhizosphaerae TaxID=2711216 RepID=UPI0013ED396A|nr:hypothetical protein [Paludisphaera rhizosphaerae]